MLLSARPVEQRLQFTVPHHYSRAEARARTQHLLEYWDHRYGIKSVWQGDRAYLAGHAWGVYFDGIVDVTDREVRGTASDPGYFLRSTALDYVTRKMRKYLHPQYLEP